jgi:hypothetical protein
VPALGALDGAKVVDVHADAAMSAEIQNAAADLRTGFPLELRIFRVRV